MAARPNPRNRPAAHARGSHAIADALETFRGTPRDEWFATRTVGRRALPTNVIGLLFHLAEHTQRHTGQVITTTKIVRAIGAPRD